jgi:hypothetical protein
MKPFIFEIPDGYLIGLYCAKCISAWLSKRNVTHKEVNRLPIRRDLLTELIANRELGVMYEITNDGHSTRVECYIEKYPSCDCVTPIIRANSKRLNFAFSSILQIKSTRYGTQNGNVWLSIATQDNGTTTFGYGNDKEESRINAAFPDTKSKDVAQHVVNHFQSQHKQPMLIVGANNWVRQYVPFYLLQEYDIFTLFYPNSLNTWVCGIMAMSRTNPRAKPIWSFDSNQTSEKALKNALWGLIHQTMDCELEEHNPKLNVWATQWIYKCPKIGLRDILALEKYSGDIVIEEKKSEPVQVNNIFRLIRGGKAA